ncbi:substrate-binding domain-containing protein [Hyalangium versicolor]|uniref:substrate-binding domain-containing protein n=1 Tax=Hyalangium versicolor TaxID=2861190 RepID=UPI001CCD1BC3|nr:substrate-binding domain-containing protein [Hyalangium versicolor]
MSSWEPNRVRQVREARGLSQVALATSSGLTRQSVGAIEAGRSMPAVDVALRIAKALDCRVEDLFGTPSEDESVLTEPASSSISGRVAMAHIAGRWVSYALDGEGMRISADALAAASHGSRVQVSPVRAPPESRENLVVMGCAPALGLLADRLNSRPGPGRFLWMPRSSTAALEALARRHTHLAGVHLVDPKTGDANLSEVHRLAGAEALVVITLARWEEGLVTAPKNPKRIRSAGDLGRRGLRLVVREPGSGARRLLEREMRAAGISLESTSPSRIQANGHLEVAQAVSLGAADTGVATRDAAIAFGLDFVPLAEERYDLALPLDSLADPRVQRLLDVMTAAPFRRELSSLGYDVRSCGDRVAELPAA